MNVLKTEIKLKYQIYQEMIQIKEKKDKKNNKKILTENQEKQRIIHAILLIRLVSNIKFFKKIKTPIKQTKSNPKK